MKTIMTMFILLSACPYASTAATRTYLLKAKLINVEERENGPRTTFPLEPGKYFTIDGSYRLRFEPIVTLKGKPFRHEVTFDQASARPKVGGIYLILFDLDRGVPTMLWHSYIARGFCMEDADIAKYGLKNVAARLKGKFPCDKTL